jgi:hypothetical protein
MTNLRGFLRAFLKGLFDGFVLEGHPCDLGHTKRLLQLWRVPRGGEGDARRASDGALKSDA